MESFWKKDRICLICVYEMIGIVRIPREFLPPEQIFDIGFYVKGIKVFSSGGNWGSEKSYQMLRVFYREMTKNYGIWVICVWIGTVFVVGLVLLENRRRKRDLRHRQKEYPEIR